MCITTAQERIQINNLEELRQTSAVQIGVMPRRRMRIQSHDHVLSGRALAFVIAGEKRR